MTTDQTASAGRTEPDRGGAVSGAHHGPDPSGHWGEFGGRFIPEALIAALDELAKAYPEALADREFQAELARLGREYAGLPSLLLYLLMGVALGVNGIGIQFDNAEVAHALGFAALAVIPEE